MDWTGNRSNERFRYVVATWPDLMESGEIGNITGGSVCFKALSSIKQTCEFSFSGGTPPNTVDAVRIYYGFTDENGEKYDAPLATFLVSYSSIDTTDNGGEPSVSGTVEGVSMLSVLSDCILGERLTINAGANAVNEAKSICERFNLKFYSDSSLYTLSSPHTFSPEDNYLAVVNWLLSAAGFRSANVDSYGYVVFKKYEDRDTQLSKDAAWEFGQGENSIMMDVVNESNDWQQTANTVRLLHETEVAQVTAWAKCVSGSKASLNARGGREKTLFESVSELKITDADIQRYGSKESAYVAILSDKARKRLLDVSNEIIHLEWKHAYVPISTDDPVSVSYCGEFYLMTITNMDISLTPSVPCSSKGRTFLTNDMRIETGGAANWTI